MDNFFHSWIIFILFQIIVMFFGNTNQVLLLGDSSEKKKV